MEDKIIEAIKLADQMRKESFNSIILNVKQPLDKNKFSFNLIINKFMDAESIQPNIRILIEYSINGEKRKIETKLILSRIATFEENINKIHNTIKEKISEDLKNFIFSDISNSLAESLKEINI